MAMRATWSQVLRTSGRTPAPSRSVLQLGGRNVVDAHAGFRGSLGHALGLSPLDQDPLHVVRVRPQRLEHRVDAVHKPHLPPQGVPMRWALRAIDHSHSTSTASAISRFCFSQRLSVQMKKLNVPSTLSLPAAVKGMSNSTPWAAVGCASARPSFCLSSFTAGPDCTVSEMGASGETCAPFAGTTSTLACAAWPFFTLTTLGVSTR